MAAKKKTGKKPTKRSGRHRMTSTNVVFAELEAMSRSEQEEIAFQLLDWIHENGLAP